MNRLAGESSPYLRQHADNPVDWYPWGDEAFARARAEDKPILLSVGYSTCHWCHVMAHESFEDPEVAAVMNRLFVNVKVDREERPDVDGVYMQAVQAMTGRGGWPMTVFLDHDGRPFYGGTYFPRSDRHGMPGILRVMDAVDEAWRTRRTDLLAQAEKLRDAIARTAAVGDGSPGTPLSYGIVARAVDGVLSQFDARFGGFGRAPKFPQAMTIDLLLRALVREPRPELREAITVSLDAMAAGGIYDQVGGGFHRYSVDDFWLVPHFEKMLYDQALLAGAYLRAWLVTAKARYRRIVEETIGYVLRDLRHPEGGFFSAEDADSEGVEGKFYCWPLDEVVAACGDDAPEVIRAFGITAGGNFEDPHTGFRGNILHLVDRDEEPSPVLARATRALLEARDARVRPGRDEKVLVAWNALFLRTLTEAAVALGREDWLDAARRNARFLLRALRRPDGRLLRSWSEGTTPQLLAYAEDYAALAGALLTLAELDDIHWLPEARTMVDEMIRLFADDERGGFFVTGVDAEQLIVRPKDSQDNATPSENSLAAEALLRLATLTGDAAYAERAERWLRVVAPIAAEHPTAFAHLLGAVERAVVAPIEVAVLGPPDDPSTKELRATVHRRLLPASVVVSAPPGQGGELTPLLAGRELLDGRPTAYVCERYACRRPVTDAVALANELDAALAARLS